MLKLVIAPKKATPEKRSVGSKIRSLAARPWSLPIGINDSQTGKILQLVFFLSKSWIQTIANCKNASLLNLHSAKYDYYSYLLQDVWFPVYLVAAFSFQIQSSAFLFFSRLNALLLSSIRIFWPPEKVSLISRKIINISITTRKAVWNLFWSSRNCFYTVIVYGSRTLQ